MAERVSASAPCGQGPARESDPQFAAARRMVGPRSAEAAGGEEGRGGGAGMGSGGEGETLVSPGRAWERQKRRSRSCLSLAQWIVM